MIDIVDRLRGTPLWRHSTPPSRELEESDLGLEAAEEIERLRAVLNSDSANRYWEGRWRDEKAENERLRAALDEQVAQ